MPDEGSFKAKICNKGREGYFIMISLERKSNFKVYKANLKLIGQILSKLKGEIYKSTTLWKILTHISY